MRVAIVGGTGLIGSAWAEQWSRHYGEVVLFARDPERAPFSDRPSICVRPWPPSRESLRVDAVINLAGETINQRWTRAAKKRIFDSRIDATRTVVQAILEGRWQTKLLINASAVGFYGSSLDRTFTEEDGAPRDGGDFLAKVAAAWEAEAKQARASGVRLVIARFGATLARGGGAFPKMELPYRLFVGGPIGRGDQWLSWIQLRDAVRLLNFCLFNDDISGPVNFTAPRPVTMDAFGRALAQATGRPHWLPLPTFLCRVALGEMSDLILKGQKAIPKKALNFGFAFEYPDIEQALDQLINEPKRS